MELSICWTGCGIVIGFRKGAASAVAVTGKQASSENESQGKSKKTDGDVSKFIHVKTEWRGKGNDPVEVLQRAENGQPASLLKRSKHEGCDERRQANGNDKKNDPLRGCGQGPGAAAFSRGDHFPGGGEYFGARSGTGDGHVLRKGGLSRGGLSRGDFSGGELSEGGLSENKLSGKYPSEDNTSEEYPSGESPTGAYASEEYLSGDNPFGDNLSEEYPSAVHPSEEYLTGDNLFGNDLSRFDHSGFDRSENGFSEEYFSGAGLSGGQPAGVFGEGTFRKEAAYFFHLTQSAVSEIKTGIRAAAEKGLGRAELIRSLRRLLRRYMELTAGRALAFRVAINNVILLEAATYCSIHLEIQELQLLWGRKR